MEEIFGRKDPTEQEIFANKKNIDETGENFQQLTGSSGLPVPPIPSKPMKETVTSERPEITSLRLEQRGFIFFPTKDTLNRFITEFNPIKIEDKLLIIYAPQNIKQGNNIQFLLYLNPVQWPPSDPYPEFEHVEAEIQFKKTHFFVILNSETYSYHPEQLPGLRKLVDHPLLKVLIFDERLAIHMDLDLPNYYYCRWSDLSDGFSWLVTSLLGRLTSHLERSPTQTLVPIDVPPPPNKFGYIEDFEIFDDWKICARHGPHPPEEEMVKCGICEAILCLPCYKDIYAQMLCPGSLYRNQDFHEFKTIY